MAITGVECIRPDATFDSLPYFPWSVSCRFCCKSRLLAMDGRPLAVFAAVSALIMTIVDLDAWKAQRRRVLETGLIKFVDMSISCATRNMSNDGPALEVGSQVGIPDQFTLFVVAEKKTYSCNVVWRKGSRIGIAFH
jgi:hypothetical protein